MNLCNNHGRSEIAYETHDCPACEDVAEMQASFIKLEAKLDDTKYELMSMEQEKLSIEAELLKCVCSKLA